MEKLPITALVTSLNEGHLLDECLSKLAFCDEVLIVNLESTDNTIEVAQKYTSNIISHKRVPLVEIIHNEFFPKVDNNWILILDPDEVLSDGLVERIKVKFDQVDGRIGMINFPILYYFGDTPLRGTRWGGVRYIKRLIHRERVNNSDNVHKGISLKAGYEKINIKYEKGVILHHYWMQNQEQFIEKHSRYLLKEGESLFNKGKQFSILKQIFKSIYEFINSYILKSGFKDGYLGFYLSVFWGWYVFMRWDSLRTYEKEINKN